MRKVRSAFIKLQPTNHAVIGKIFRDARLRDAQVLCKPRLDGFGAAVAGPPAQKIGNSDAQSLAGLDIVIGGEVGIGENEDSWADRRVIGFLEFDCLAG